MSRLAKRPTLLMLIAVSAMGAFAHEGEVHGAPTPTAPAAAARHTMPASSSNFELVVKNGPLQSGESAKLDVYLSDFETNAPIPGASVRLNVRARNGGREIWSGEAGPTTVAGVYAATFTPSDTGAVNVIASVRAGGREDEFVLAGLEIEAPGRAVPALARMRWSLPLWIGIGAVLLAGVLVVALRLRRRTASAVFVIAATSVAFATARGHEGHDEAPATSGAALEPGGIVYLGKESQFLLEVRTKPIALETVSNRLHAQGRVAPRNGGELDITAPQSGRIYFPGGRTPMLGQHVKRGQQVATLVVVDSLKLRSALSGVVTEVVVVNGQLVDAGQKILRVLDSSVLWVHADIYERDLASVESSRFARILSPAYPNEVFEGRRVALGASLGEVPGTVEAYFEVPNPQGRLRVGMLVDVEVEKGGSQSALVIPRSAIIEKDGRSLVFVHIAPERFSAREVRQVSNLGDRIAVQGDLKPGDRIVTSGSYQLLTAPVVALGS